MAVFLLSKRIAQSLVHLLFYHHQSKILINKFSTKKCCYYKKSPKSFLNKLNRAQFYNRSKLCNVSTYENLVKQKSTPDSGNKCENKEHPGRHKFHKDVEIALNDQIEMEFNASFAYLSMASYFGRSEVALPGCQGFFMLMHQEEHEHAIIFLNYILMRGGHIKVPSISAPEQQEWNNIEKTFNTAVEMECEVKEKLEQLIEICETHSDLQLIDFISGELLEEQNRSIHSLSRLFTRAKMVNDNEIGEFLFDQHIYESFVKHHQPHQKNLMYLNHLPSSNEEVKEVYK